MMKVLRMMKNYLPILFVAGCIQQLSGITAFNTIRQFDPNFFPAFHEDRFLQFTTIAGFGTEKARGHDPLGFKTNVLQRYYPYQDALAMLQGFPVASQQAQLGQQININADQGLRGHFNVTGELKVPFSGLFEFRWNIRKGFWMGLSLPVMAVHMKNVTWIDETLNVTLDDALTHDLLTDAFVANVAELGDGLSIGDWKKAGVGDLALYTGWRQHFIQEKNWIKEAVVNLRVGALFPTGVKKDEDVAVSFEFGNDGSYAVPVAAGLDLRFRRWFWLGVDITFMKIFNNTRYRRIQTDPSQTDLLLLQKAWARKEYGLTQMFSLYWEPIVYKGTSIRFAYECNKHNEDHVYPFTNEFSSSAANSSLALDEWSTHDLFIQAKFDSDRDPKHPKRYSVEAMGFAKLPFNGKSSWLVTLAGFDLVVNF